MTPGEHRLRQRELRLREREMALRHWQARDAASARIAENGFRALFVMNGVGTLALGAFLAAAIPIPEAEDLLAFIVMAIALNAVGLVCAASLHWTRLLQRRHEDRRNVHGTRNPWWWLTFIVATMSALLFVLGIAILVYAGFTQLGPLDDTDDGNAHVTRTHWQ